MKTMIRHQSELITSKKDKLIGWTFQLLHANVGNLEFLGKNGTIPQYVLVVVDLYSSKVYVYQIRSRKQILQKMNCSMMKLKVKERINV